MAMLRRALQAYHRGIWRVSVAGAVLSAVLLVAMVAHILLEILLRGAFASSTFVVAEFVGYGVAAITFNTLGYALEKGVLIRVSLVTQAVARWPLARRGLELLAIVSTLWVTGLAVVFYGDSVARHWGRGSVSETVAEMPLWIPEGLMLVGLVVFWLQLLSYLIRVLGGAPPIDAAPGQG